MSRNGHMRVTHSTEPGGYNVRYTAVWKHGEVQWPDQPVLGKSKADFVYSEDDGDTSVDDLLERVGVLLSSAPAPDPDRPVTPLTEDEQLEIIAAAKAREKDDPTASNVISLMGRTAHFAASEPIEEGFDESSSYFPLRAA